jgi:uncharacterized protein YbaP (TraB family)
MGLLNRLRCFRRAVIPGPRWIFAVRQRHLHLVGSIHMGTRDVPLPAQLLKNCAADALIVEADIASSETPFADIPDSPLAERLSPALLTELRETIEA